MDEKQIIFIKKKYAQKLFREGNSYEQVRSMLKVKYGTSFSNRDLQKLRASDINIPKNAQVYIDSFEICFSVLCNLRKTSKQAQDTVNEFADLFFDLEKQRIMDALPKDLRMDDIILNGMEMIDKKKEIYITNKKS